jgi:peptidyl-prolyl cis-trans isomerase C
METPDGKEFKGGQASQALVRAAAEALMSAVLMLLRAIGKLIMTTWRLAAALDSALWRATKLLLRKTVNGLAYSLGLAVQAFHYLLLWLPTRWGRAYSAVSGVMLAIAILWIVDALRAGPGADIAGQSMLRPPIDEGDPILARIEGRYVHLSEIETAARAGGFLRAGEVLTPETAFQRELVRSYVEQRLLARAALDDGMQRAPQVLRRVNAARDRVLAAAFLDARIRDSVSPATVERLYTSQRDITMLGDQVRVRHILVETGAQAEEIIALLKDGADFGALARERSIDRATAPLGGEVGWFSKIMMAPAFSQVAFATPPGEIAPPFQTEFGWHVMEVLGRRSTNAVPFSEVQDNIEEFLRLRAIDETIKELEQENQVVYFVPETDTNNTTPAPPDLTAPDLVDAPDLGPSDIGVADGASEDDAFN